MNIIEISCPAKTFILGEYAVLDGGPALVLNTAPRFVCRIQKINLILGKSICLKTARRPVGKKKS